MSRLTVSLLHEAFIADLGDWVESYSLIENKPIDVVLRSPMRPIKVYIYNLTKPPGGRSENEYKIQIILPGQKRGAKGNFDFSQDHHFVMLAGYEPTFGVWILWDAYMYRDFSFSRNVQVLAPTLIKAASSGIGRQIRKTKQGHETVIACSRRNLVLGIQMRFDLWSRDTVKRA